jgi:glutamate synthase domain-containing protein 1
LMYWETPRDIASCGILGILRRDGASKIKADETLTSIECVRYRGSRVWGRLRCIQPGCRKPL